MVTFEAPSCWRYSGNKMCSPVAIAALKCIAHATQNGRGNLVGVSASPRRRWAANLRPAELQLDQGLGTRTIILTGGLSTPWSSAQRMVSSVSPTGKPQYALTNG